MNIKERKILVPSYLTNRIYPVLLKTNKQNYTFGTKIDNIYSLLNEDDYTFRSDTSIVFDVYNLIQDNKSHFNVFKDILNNVSFINQFISFYKECIYYEIDIDKLPVDSDEEKEIKKIIELIDSLNLNIKDNYLRFKNKVKQYEIINDFYGQFIEYKLLKDSINDGCKKYDIDDVFAKQSNNHFFKATTRAKEIDGVARYIINNCDISNCQVIANKDIYMEDIERIFKAYDIPINRISYSKDSVLVNRIKYFIQFLINKDNKSILKVLRSNDNYSKLCDYIEHFEIKVDELLKPFERFSFIDYERINNCKDYEERNNILKEYKLLDIIDWSKCEPLVKLEIEAEKTRKQILEDINKWINNDPYESIKDYYNQIINNTNWNEYEDDYSAFSNAGRIIVEANNKKVDLNVLLEVLNTCVNSDNNKDSNALIISDMDHILMDKKTTIVLGANEGDFLPSLEKNQIIKEDYVSKINNYPSLEERLDFLQLKMNCLKKISPEIIISYCYSDYSGSEHKLSSYIESSFNVDENDFNEWDEITFEYHKNINYVVPKDKTRKLFIKEDNSILGSVSSLEQYQSCPYSYFLQRGLRLAEIEGYQKIDPAILGTLRHKVFEILGQNSFNDEKMLEELLDEYMGEIKRVFNNNEDEIEIKRRMIGDILKLNEIIARDIQNTNAYTSSLQEHRLNKEKVQAGDYHFNFTAIVDRIDYDDDFYRVVDYKSSNMKFSTARFDDGQQLQLITYLWLLWKKKQINANPVGAYYFDLNLSSKKGLDKNVLEAFNDSNIAKELFIKENYLQGFTIPNASSDKETHDILKNNNYLEYTKSANDNRPIESKEKYDIHTIEGIDMFLSELYEKIALRIAEGNFETRPDQNTCRYCPYSPICHKKFQDIQEIEEENV